MTPTLWGIAAGGSVVVLLGAFLWGFAVGKRRFGMKLAQSLAEAEERLEAAKRGEDAQHAQNEAFNRARGGLGRRVRRRLRELGRIE